MPRARENICLTGKQLWELLLERGARKPRAKWTLSNGALALLAWNVGIRAQHHHGLQPARPRLRGDVAGSRSARDRGGASRARREATGCNAAGT